MVCAEIATSMETYYGFDITRGNASAGKDYLTAIACGALSAYHGDMSAPEPTLKYDEGGKPNFKKYQDEWMFYFSNVGKSDAMALSMAKAKRIDAEEEDLPELE